LDLKGEICIASNKIFLAFNKTPWRPNYFTVADRLVAENNRGEIRSLDLFKIFLYDINPILGFNSEPDVKGYQLYYPGYPSKFDHQDRYVPQFYRGPPTEGFYVGETISFLNIQLAHYLGCNPIILIGIDGSYQKSQTKTSHHAYGEVYAAQNEKNHFLDNYREQGETWSIPRPEIHEQDYRFARKYLLEQGISLWNASRSSVVKAIERVDFDSLF
jgi:hypothetical protein